MLGPLGLDPEPGLVSASVMTRMGTLPSSTMRSLLTTIDALSAFGWVCLSTHLRDRNRLRFIAGKNIQTLCRRACGSKVSRTLPKAFAG
jgi:hypothetical protein